MRNRIREIRERLGLSLEALAERLGTTPMSLSRLERGKTRLKLEDVPKIADALGVEWHEIIGESPFLSTAEAKVIEAFRELPEDRKPNAEPALRALNPFPRRSGSEAAD